MSTTAIERIEAMLYDTIGLDPTTVGSSLVERAVNRRMLATGEASSATYASRLATERQELQELVEEVVIPETYFFREPEALDAIAQRVARQPRTAPLRILSAPCSTGEEPYSIAMTLLEAGIPASAFAIDAVDVSREAVRRARAAVYRKNAFRGTTSGLGFFDVVGEEHRLQARVRQLVKVTQANLLDAGFDPPHASYDIIFCRNLLIYFDTATQARVLEALTRVLVPGGLLVVGAADTFAVRRAGFTPLAGAERAFLFVRASEVETETAPIEAPRKAKRSTRATRAVRGDTRTHLVPRPAKRTMRAEAASPPVSSAEPGPPAGVAAIVTLANAGRFDDAIRLAESALALDSENAELHALAGMMHSARRDDTRAEQSYRRALYIDPQNADALAHLAVLVEHRGDTVAASRLRARAQRTDAGGAA